jgi:hypothetical protein
MQQQQQQQLALDGRLGLHGSLHRSLSADAAFDPALAHAAQAALVLPRPASAGPAALPSLFHQQRQQQQQQRHQKVALLQQQMAQGEGAAGWSQSLHAPLDMPLAQTQQHQHHRHQQQQQQQQQQHRHQQLLLLLQQQQQQQQQQRDHQHGHQRHQHLQQPQHHHHQRHHHHHHQQAASPSLDARACAPVSREGSAPSPTAGAMLPDAPQLPPAPVPTPSPSAEQPTHTQPTLPGAGPSGPLLAGFPMGDIAAALAADMGGLDDEVADLTDREFQHMMEVLAEPAHAATAGSSGEPALLLPDVSPAAAPVAGMVPVAPSADPTAGAVDPRLWDDAMDCDTFGLAAAAAAARQEEQQAAARGLLAPRARQHSPPPRPQQASPQPRQRSMLMLGGSPGQGIPAPGAGQQGFDFACPGSLCAEQQLLLDAELQEQRLASAMEVHRQGGRGRLAGLGGPAGSCDPTFSSCAQAAALMQQQAAQLQGQPEPLRRPQLMLDLSTQGSPCGVGGGEPGGLKPPHLEPLAAPGLAGSVLHELEAAREAARRQQLQLQLQLHGASVFFGGSCDSLLDAAVPGGWPSAAGTSLELCGLGPGRGWPSSRPITMLGMAAGRHPGGAPGAPLEGSPAGENLSAATPSSATAWALGLSSSGCSVAGPLARACQMPEFL